jgi:hypothetical protein
VQCKIPNCPGWEPNSQSYLEVDAMTTMPRCQGIFCILHLFIFCFLFQIDNFDSSQGAVFEPRPLWIRRLEEGGPPRDGGDERKLVTKLISKLSCGGNGTTAIPQMTFPQTMFPWMTFPQTTFPRTTFPQTMFPQTMFPQNHPKRLFPEGCLPTWRF